ncbi:hypothetical protein D9613_004509 [Agrocybe pediades]|uniref:F-box domain-containing protein n=1 Tax=Agrocybe pediades TaxID=84607 RepID=A0A8H4QJQ0_9AGAR|nr:hypothetical protein D9613_004509 [Agrocybe pediades]
MLHSPCIHARKQPNVIDLCQLEYNKFACPNDEGTCALCRKLPAVEKNIEDAVAHLKDLLNEHQQLKTEINHTHSPIIRDLPEEILSRIFFSYCWDKAGSMHEGKLVFWRNTHAPLKIGAVCRTWRQVAWASPELWTEIVLKRWPSNASYICNQYTIAKEWIRRSGALPLLVSLTEYGNEENSEEWDSEFDGEESDAEEDNEEEDDSEVDDADDDTPTTGQWPNKCICWKLTLRLAEQCCDRWENVTMDLSRASFKYIASNLKLIPPTRNLALRSRRDSINLRFEGHKILRLWRDSRFGPQQVALYEPIRFGHFDINWQHVSCVRTERWSARDCLDLLRNAPQLVSCSFTEVSKFWHIPEPVTGEPVICHKALQNLSFHSQEWAVTFFDHVAFPSLEDFDYPPYHYRDLPNKIDDPSLLPFFSRSGFPLAKLSIAAHMFTPQYMIAILATIPSLIHFNVYCQAIFPVPVNEKTLMAFFLRHLAETATFGSEHHGNSQIFLPRLEMLELTGRWPYEFPWDCVPDIFAYPSNLEATNRRPLKSIVIDTSRPHCVKGLPDVTVARLVTLQAEGINLNYRVLQVGQEAKLVPVTWE